MLLIVKKLAKLRDVPYKKVLYRRNNITQHFAKTAEQRRVQAEEFFGVRGDIDEKATYVVVDDIFTTGSTIKEATKQLRKAGAKKVHIVVIARHKSKRVD